MLNILLIIILLSQENEVYDACDVEIRAKFEEYSRNEIYTYYDEIFEKSNRLNNGTYDISWSMGVDFIGNEIKFDYSANNIPCSTATYIILEVFISHNSALSNPPFLDIMAKSKKFKVE